MQETSTSPATILQFRQDIEAQFRRHIREALDIALAEELAAALGSDRHERTEQRRGYRNGSVTRTLTTPDGTRSVTVPRGRIVSADGATQEFHSQLLPRYARRTREIDDRPGLLGTEMVSVVKALDCSPDFRILETGEKSNPPKASGATVVLTLGSERRKTLTLVCKVPSDPAKAVLLADVLRIGRAAIELERARDAERNRAAIWPASQAEEQAGALFLAEDMQTLLAKARRIAPTRFRC